MVRKFARFALLSVATACGAPAAVAGVYSDDLGKCLVGKTTGEDRLLLVQWMFAAIASHPAVQPLASVTPAQRTGFNEKAAALFSRLLAESCRKESLAAIKYEGTASVEASFSLLGQISMKDLTTEQEVGKAMAGMGAYIEKDEKLKALLVEAGVMK